MVFFVKLLKIMKNTEPLAVSSVEVTKKTKI